MLTTIQTQRLSTFCAAQSRNFFDIAESFASAMEASFPDVRQFVRVASKRDRVDFANQVAELLKNFAHLSAFEGRFARVGNALRASGFNATTAQTARHELLKALRSHAGLSWNSEIEQDWNDLFDIVTSGMGFEKVQSGQRVRVAA